MKSPVSPSYVRQEAKKLKKQNGIQLSEAYEVVVRRFGYINYKHYLNESRNHVLINSQINIRKREKPVITVKLTGHAREMFRDLFEMVNLPEEKAYKALLKVIKSDINISRKETAASVLLNYFVVPSDQISKILESIPVEYHPMLSHYIENKE